MNVHTYRKGGTVTWQRTVPYAMHSNNNPGHFQDVNLECLYGIILESRDNRQKGSSYWH